MSCCRSRAGWSSNPADGATEFLGETQSFVATPPVDVVEVVGAGDAFAAGYLASLLDGAPSHACLTPILAQ